MPQSTLGPALRRLRRLTPSVAEPRSFLVGTAVNTARLPANIVVFSRRDRHSLVASEKTLYFNHRFVLCLNLDTAADVLLEDHWLRFRPGEYLLIFPFQLHTFRELESESLSWLFLTFEMADTRWLENLRDRILPIPPTVVGEVERATNCWIAHRENASELPYRVALLLSALVAAAESEKTKKIDRRRKPEAEDHGSLSFRGLVSRIHAILADEKHAPRIKDLAQLLQMSESFLRSEFRRLTGVSLGSYMRQARLHRGAALLAGTRLQIREIAVRCGFDAPFSFTRAFEQCVGLSPQKFRRRFAPSKTEH